MSAKVDKGFGVGQVFEHALPNFSLQFYFPHFGSTTIPTTTTSAATRTASSLHETGYINTLGPALVDETTRWSRCRPTNQTIYDFQVENLNGTYQDLNSYRGQVLLIVNVATFCAYTQQYTDFNPILQQNSQYGMSILAFPCNQFYLQEPAENHEILNGLRYVRPGNGWTPHQNLDIFGKIDVNGDNQHPLYEFLKDSCPPTTNRIGKREELMYDSIKTTDITWNFEKFLIDRQGRPRFRFHPTNWVHGQSVMQFIQPLLNEGGGQQQQQQGGSFYQPQMQGQGQQQGQGQFRRQY